MPGRINEEDIALVRERARIDELVGSYVMLKPAGGGSLKGLCPFHDEKTPSFHVTPARGFFYCFGCGEGGDAIDFLQKIGNLSFTEAVQQLADRVGVVLRQTDDDNARKTEPGLRSRILDANATAAEFFQAQLMTPDAVTARQMLDGRGFDRAAASRFGVGYAPRGGRELRNHLQRKGFSESELVRAGLVRESGYDFFAGRVVWPIRDSANSVLGFGARKLYDDDRLPSKYINTPETPVYKKSHVLYGLDLARPAIGRKSQAVVMEGYTDVMAAQLSGVDTAVASCGTAFGEDHARLLQRLMGNHDAFNGEVIFTFDGDQAGQNAAIKVFSFDQSFISQTYVAVEKNGLDPCDLRLAKGDAAVRDLVGQRVPLYRFVMTNLLRGYDLDRADGRLAALRAAAPLVSSVRDASLVSGYARELASMLGMELEEVRAEVSRVRGRRVSDPVTGHGRPAPTSSEGQDELVESSLPWPDAADRQLSTERGTLKLMLQAPGCFDQDWSGVTVDDFTHPAYRALARAVLGVPGDLEHRADRLREFIGDPTAQQLLVALLVEPLMREPDAAYASMYAAKLQEIAVLGQIKSLKGKLQRTNPVEHPSEHRQMFAEYVALEARRKDLQQASVGLFD